MRSSSRTKSAPALAPHLDGAAAREPQLQVADEAAADRERHRRAHDALGAPAVGRRVDLLRRHVDDVSAPAQRRLLGRPPARRRHQADGQVGSGAAEADRVEAALVECLGAPAQAGHVLPPGGDRIGLVQPGRGRDRLPEPLDVGLAEDGAGPAGVRVADDRPGHLAVRHRQQPLGQLPAASAGDARAVEVGEQLRLRVAGDRDDRAVVRGEVVDERHLPRRRPLELLLGHVPDARPPQVRVVVDRLDVVGAALVRDPGERAHER